MKEDDIKRQSMPILSINSPLIKPNQSANESPSKKTEYPNDNNKILEKASKFINYQNNVKNSRSSYTGAKLFNTQNFYRVLLTKKNIPLIQDLLLKKIKSSKKRAITLDIKK